MRCTPSLVYIFFLARVFALEDTSGTHICCREEFKNVSFSHPPLHGSSPYDCEVVRVIPDSKYAAVTISCQNRPIEERTTHDLGATWLRESLLDPISSPLPLARTDLTQASNDGKVLYQQIRELGLYLRSTDAGKTWSLPAFRVADMSQSKLKTFFGGGEFHALEFQLAGIDPRNPLKIYAGITLRPWAAMIVRHGDLSVIEVPGLYWSSNGGESWEKFSDAPLNSAPLGISPSNPNVIYSQGHEGVIKSIDAGKSWNIVGQNAALISSPSENSEAQKDAPTFEFEVREFAVDMEDENIVFLTSNKGFFRSLDGGRTWCLLNLGFDEIGAAHSLAINPGNPNEIFVGTARGVFYSKDRGCHFIAIFPRT